MKTQARFPLVTTFVIALATALASLPSKAEDARPDAAKKKGSFTGTLLSPEISNDRQVTFRLRAPNAMEVSVVGELPGGTHKMAKDEQGVWSVTLGPLPPELYGYTFVVDGLRLPDPANSYIKPMRSPTTSILDIPGDPPLLHDFQNVPHGTVRVHYYHSKITGSLRRMHIHTPPGYEQDPTASFLTLYLFHGSGDNGLQLSSFSRSLNRLARERGCSPASHLATTASVPTGRDLAV